MFAHFPWQVDQTKILTRRELAAVITNLQKRGKTSVNARQTLAIMRLACCCGLRVSEIAALRLDDVCVGVDRPHLRVRREVAKGRRPRNVPLWWDAGTLADISSWKEERKSQGAIGEDLLVCSLLVTSRERPLSRHALRLRFQRACGVLGRARAARVTIHDGRHTFISHALAGGRTLAEVRDAAGHSNVATTSVYLHLAVEDADQVGNLFTLVVDST
jgi:integrase/recombinase XerD